jgi:hypothetical protein
MTSQFPSKLVLPADFLIIILCVEDIVFVGTEFIVIVLDEV